MSRRPRISSKRGQQELREEIRKLNKRVQNKKYYEKTTYGVELDLDTIKVSDIVSWRDLDRAKRDLKKNIQNAPKLIRNEHGVVFDRSVVKQIERLERRVNRQRETDWNEIKDQPYRDPHGRTIGEVQQQRHLGNPKFTRFRKFKFDLDSFYSEKELAKYMDRLKRNNAPLGYTEGDLRMKENYLKGFENVFNQSGDPEQVILDARRRRIRDYIKNMTMEDFLQMFYSETIVGFDYNYSREEEESKLSELETVFGLE